jgi:hypothetical protein
VLDLGSRSGTDSSLAALAGIVTAQQLLEGVTCDASLWATCVGGAMQKYGVTTISLIGQRR